MKKIKKHKRGIGKMIVFKKRQVITIVLVLMLICAGYLNYVYMDKEPGGTDQVANIDHNDKERENYGEAEFVSKTNETKEDYFTETKLNKDKTRSESVAILKGVVENKDTTVAAKEEAQANIIKTAKNIEKEGSCENILMGKGFKKVSVYINDDTVTVAVLTPGLQPTDVAKIRDVIISETKCSIDKLKIMEIK